MPSTDNHKKIIPNKRTKAISNLGSFFVVRDPLSRRSRCRNYNNIYKQKIRTLHQSVKSSDYSFLVGRGGFEPPKSLTADLQSAPFGHSGTYPYKKTGAGGRTRTPDLLITNQLLYQLSYTSIFKRLNNIPQLYRFVKQYFHIF